MKMKNEWFGLFGVVVFSVFVLLSASLVLQWSWNSIMPLFGVSSISFGQSLALLFLLSIVTSFFKKGGD